MVGRGVKGLIGYNCWRNRRRREGKKQGKRKRKKRKKISREVGVEQCGLVDIFAWPKWRIMSNGNMTKSNEKKCILTQKDKTNLKEFLHNPFEFNYNLSNIRLHFVVL